MNPREAITLAIFVLTYVTLAFGKLPGLRLDRVGAAYAGAVATVLVGALNGRAAIDAIDFPTLALLLGMMIVVANLRLTGAFARSGRWILSRAHSGRTLLALTIAISGVLAAFFINDVVCLALTPLLIETAATAGADPVPLLLGLATASNIGSVATITGNPQNMIVAGFAHIGYLPFVIKLAPAAIIGLFIDYAVIATVYRHSLKLHDGIAPAQPEYEVPAGMLIKSILVAAGTLAMFVMGFPIHLVALGAGAVLLFTRRIRPQKIYGLIDWTMLLMFAGLFIVVAGAESTGLPNTLVRMIGLARLGNTVILAIATAVLSNLVSNVPAVLLFRPLYPLLGSNPHVALIIASASTLAGNLTVLGSIANLIVIEQARRRKVKITFNDYVRVGIPITILTLTVDIALLSFGL
ncbi:MAG: anion transporter [Candidatus Binataceae bacterium]|nr:anion transporter [Candidatus Binataceae bacterium]